MLEESGAATPKTKPEHDELKTESPDPASASREGQAEAVPAVAATISLPMKDRVEEYFYQARGIGLALLFFQYSVRRQPICFWGAILSYCCSNT